MEKWKRFTNRGPSWHPSRWSSICSRHFLTSDFRDHIARKYLKRSAVPSVTIKSVVDYASIQLDMNVNFDGGGGTTMAEPPSSELQPPPPPPSPRPQDQICRLCANRIAIVEDESTATTTLDDPSTLMSIRKCFPAIRVDDGELFPKRICIDCAAKIRQFSEFIDHVSGVQSDLWQRFGTGECGSDSTVPNVPKKVESTNKIVASTKPLIIKQEPFVNVKQEFVDSTRSVLLQTSVAADLDIVSPLNLLPENDAFCEFCDAYFINNLELKNHIVKYHSDNSREVPNNCEIMEIITLENAFINLADDNCAEEEEEDGGGGGEQQQQHQDRQNYNPAGLQHHEIHHTSNDPNDYIPLERVLKVEHLNDYELRHQLLTSIRIEHSYAVDVAAHHPGSVATYLLKQEPPAALLLQPIDTSFQVYESSHSIDAAAADTFDSYDDAYNNLVPYDEFPEPADQKQCSICSVQCKTIYHLLAHKKAFHSSRQVKRNNFTASLMWCAECSASFYSKLALNNHRRNMCPVKRGLSYRCRYCQLEFSKWILMRSHTKLCPKREQCVATKLEPIENISPLSALMAPPQKRSKWNADENSTIQLDNGRFACLLCNRSYGRRSNLVRKKKMSGLYLGFL